jgi:Tfp pilus assembly protein FimV
MAAIAYPQRTTRDERSTLRLVPAPRLMRRRPSPAVYRRRRAVTVSAALLLAAIAFGGGPLTASEPAPARLASTTGGGAYLVQPGDTLWALARRIQPTGDVRPLVERLSAARHGAPLQAGERITLPD